MRSLMKRMAAAALALLLLVPAYSLAVQITITKTNGDVETITDTDTVAVTDTGTGTDAGATAETDPGTNAREAFIDAILLTAQTVYDNANGRWQRAQYAGDIYVCKNYTMYLFNENDMRFRMAEYPDVELVIPMNSEDTADYNKGVGWETIEASQGNPFYAAAEFRYDGSLSLEENKAVAREFMTQVQRGDYFQMSANYYWGVGPHSLVFIADYDSASQTVRWTDSNMKTKKENGINYGLVQFDAVKDIGWFVDAFCHPKRGATLYRLRDDIIFADGQE